MRRVVLEKQRELRETKWSNEFEREKKMWETHEPYQEEKVKAYGTKERAGKRVGHAQAAGDEECKKLLPDTERIDQHREKTGKNVRCLTLKGGPDI